MFDTALELMVDTIATLQEIAPVHVLLVSGNHSRMAEFYIARYLEAYFRNCTAITFDSRPLKRKYIEYGNTLIGFSHGETEKKRIENIMQVEAREEWGRTLYHEWHLGHLHSEQTKEIPGLIIKHLPSITGLDLWHYNSAFVGAVKKTQGFIYDKKYGLTDTLNFIVKG